MFFTYSCIAFLSIVEINANIKSRGAVLPVAKTKEKEQIESYCTIHRPNTSMFS